MTIAALDAGKHVLCEKPMALTPEDCSRMLRARERSRGILMVAHVLRFWPAYRFLHEVVACRAYGAIRSAIPHPEIGRARLGSLAVAAGGEWRRDHSISWCTISIRHCCFSACLKT